jgi:hypothetical protein
VVQWQNVSFPSSRRGFDSPRPLDRKSQTPLLTGSRFCLVAFSILRAGIWLLSFIGVGLIPNGGTDKGSGSIFASPHQIGWQVIFSSLQRDDADWFLRIAIDGYPAHSAGAAFFPGFPLAIRALGFLGHPFFAATLISNLALLGALVVLYSLTTQEFDERIARTTIVLLCVFPTSFYFLAPYSESLFLLLSVLAFWAARRDRWALAAAATAAAGLTRIVGVLLVPALVFEAYEQHRERGAPIGPRMTAAVSGLLGPLSYFLYWQVRAGDFWTPIQAQTGWDRRLEPPWTTLFDAFKGAFSFGTTGYGYLLVDLIITLAVLALAAIGTRRLRGSFVVYVWASLLVPLLDPYPPRPLLSVPRFALVLFPLFWVLADLLDNDRLPRNLVIAASAAGLGVLAVLFMNSYPIL